jgi:hypothetical protein
MAPTMDELMQKVKILEDQVARQRDDIEYYKALTRWYQQVRDNAVKLCDDTVKRFRMGI